GQASPPPGMTDIVRIGGGGIYHSVVLAARPSPLNAVTAIAIATNQVLLSWANNSSGVDGFQVERAPNAGGVPGSWTAITNLGAGVTVYTDTAADLSNWYRVRAFNSCTTSPWSATKVPVVVLDDTWASGARTNQNLPASSAWWASTNISLTA